MVPVPFRRCRRSCRPVRSTAAWITEPFVTQASQKLGATEIIRHRGPGPRTDCPSPASWPRPQVRRSTQAFAAFQRAMAKAQTLAANRAQVEQVLPTYIKTITPQVASTITIGSFPTSLNKARLQRVPNLMQEFGLIRNHIDMQTMLLPSQS